jgi:hypothetical protein
MFNKIRKVMNIAKKATNPTTLKVKPLSDRRRLGGGKTEKIMKDLEGVKKMRIQVEQAANKNRMKYEGYEGGKRKPLKSDAKSDIKIAQDARKRRSKTRKEAAVGAVGAGTATGGALYAADKVAKKKKGQKNDKKNKK